MPCTRSAVACNKFAHLNGFRKIHQNSNKEIAIIGYSAIFPGGISDELTLWNCLKSKINLVSQIDGSRWATQEFLHPNYSERGRSVSFKAGVLPRPEMFDASFFGVSPREAAAMDPQQRLLLELSWEAMENAGVPASAFSGTNCAVYVGISSLDYGTLSLDDLAAMTQHSMAGNALSMAANRLSYFFDLRGPSVAIDTACSSSLVALHHACRALSVGEADAALVGGVNLLLHPYPFVGFTNATMLSADGRCRVFDASASGYVRSEGGAVLVLKSLEQAIEDGDDVKAVILASGVNADGKRKTGITIPSSEGQAELMGNVLAQAGLTAWDIDFVEAHGTGTQVGDPIEAAAIGAVYGGGRERPLPVGSVKGNLGHMEAASGMAGLVKAILALQQRALPPQLNYETPNPNIDFEGLNLKVNTEYTEFDKAEPLIAGVNSFGFGGVNAHVVLKEYRREAAQSELTEVDSNSAVSLPPIFLSARTDAALRELASLYSERQRWAPRDEYYDVAYGAAFKRDQLEKRLALLAGTQREAADALDIFADGGSPDGLFLEQQLPQSGGIAFVYSGNGSQWVGMGLRLLAESQGFSAAMAELDARMRPVAGFSILAELQASGEPARLDATEVAQPLIFAIQVALTQLLQMQGVRPNAVTGHSVGEVAAAWACGALNLDSAIELIVTRSRAQGETLGSGRMAAVGLSVEEMLSIRSEFREEIDVTIAAINSPKNITLSGSQIDLERVKKYLDGRGKFIRILDLEYAFHSDKMEPVKKGIIEGLDGLSVRHNSDVKFVSTVTGGALGGTHLGAEYWWRNVRKTVRFSDAVKALNDLGCRIFIEIGPNAILQRYMGECIEALAHKGRVLPTLRLEKDGLKSVHEVVLRTKLLSEEPDLDVFFPRRGGHVRLPNYPWQQEPYWRQSTNESLKSIERRRVHPLLGWRLPEALQAWENTIDHHVLPWLSDHRVGGAIVFPAAAMADMALAAAREWLGGDAQSFEELDIVAPIVFDGEHARTLRFDLSDRDGSFQIKSKLRLSLDDWTLHATGRIYAPNSRRGISKIPAVAASGASVGRAAHYKNAAALGIDYGPTFQGFGAAFVSGNLLTGEIECHREIIAEDYVLHPALLDVCYQSLIDILLDDINAGLGVALLPVKIGRLEFHQAGMPIRFRAMISSRSQRSVLADFELFDAEDLLVASVTGCRFRPAKFQRETAEKVALWRIGAILSPHPAEPQITLIPSPRSLVEAFHAETSLHNNSRDWWLDEAAALTDALAVSFAFEAFWEIAREGEDSLRALAEASDPYTNFLCSALRHDGLLSLKDDRWHLADQSELPSSKEIWRTICRDYGAALPQLLMMGSWGSRLPHFLKNPSERQGYIEVLRRSAVTETLCRNDPEYAGTRQAVSRLMKFISNDWPSTRRLRVLEVSGVAGDCSSEVLDAISRGNVDYVLALPQAASGHEQSEHDHHDKFVVASFDPINWEIAADRPLPEKFDVILLNHTLHSFGNPAEALQRARHWLADNAYILVAERTPSIRANFLEGMDDGWWRLAGGEKRHRSPLASAEAWSELLKAKEFKDVHEFLEPAEDGGSNSAFILLAQSSADRMQEPPEPMKASWLLVVDDASKTFATDLSQRLFASGQHVEAVKRLPKNLTGIDQIVYLLGWDSTPETTTPLLTETLRDVRAVAALSEKSPRLWFLTRGGVSVSGLPSHIPSNPGQATLWGMARVVMNEYAELDCKLVEIASEDGRDRLADELLWPDGASEIVLTNSGRHTLVLKETSGALALRATDDERFRLDFHTPGSIRNLVWLPQEEVELAESEIEVEVMATGLNFRDVMYLMGLLPDEAVENGFAGASLGLEFSGIVSRVGPNVGDINVGAKVMGFGSACFASHVVTRADAVAVMPDEWSFEAAATVPTVFLTAYYALKHLADLQPKERVLIHGAAGGVGIAAIQLAQHLGAEVFATAGSDEKRDFVRLLGADHVFDSRSLSFAEDVLVATNDEGVDVVLNSLSGEAIRRNLSVLRPFGRFLELGKRDFFENTPIGLRPFKDNISYFGIDADQLLNGRSRLAGNMFREVMSLFRQGVLTPLPFTEFAADRVVDAFRSMQHARHIGKIVLSLSGAHPTIERPVKDRAQLSFAKNSTWIVTGGLSGFGLASARWLAAHGVGNLVLVGRRGLDTPGAREALDDLAAQGISVYAMSCDISDAEAVKRLVEHVVETCPAVTGVLHAAAVFDDALIQNLDEHKMDAVIAPKLMGAWNLHQATIGLPLEHFVLYSSIATAIGNPGQANYVAANAGLEGLAKMRRQLALPAICIGWGPIGDTGYLSRNEAVAAVLQQRLGRAPMSVELALDQLADILHRGKSTYAANFDWNTLSAFLPSASTGRFASLRRDFGGRGSQGKDEYLEALIALKTPEELFVTVQQMVIGELSQVLALSADRIDPVQSLQSMGLDSLMGVELAMAMEQRFEIQLPVMMLSGSTTPEKVTKFIVGKLIGDTELTNEDCIELDVDARRIAEQHGETLSDGDFMKIADNAIALENTSVSLIDPKEKDRNAINH